MTRALLFSASALVLLSACNQNSDSPISPSSAVELGLANITASASVGESEGTLEQGAAPAPGDGPTITAAGNATVVNGGTLVVTVGSATPFQTIYVFVRGDALGLAVEANGGIGGFYRINLPSPQTSAPVLLTFPQEVPLREFELLFAAADPAGTVGEYVGLPTTVTIVGTGDVQVTLSWDADSDVDLHVIEPGGEETYYADRTSGTGGSLDLDSNAACRIDGVRNENITWPVGRAPRGRYTVRVDYWDSCNVARTNYTVRINNGGNVQIHRGFFTGPGDQGGLGSGVTVATFERASGPSAITINQAPGGPAQAGATKVREQIPAGRE